PGEGIVLYIQGMRQVVYMGQGGVGAAVVGNAADRDAAEADAVVGQLPADEHAPSALSPGAKVGQGDLQCGVHRLRSGIGEEHPVESGRGYNREALGQLEGQRVAHLEGRGKIHLTDLAAYRLGDFPPPMTCIAAPQPGRAIEYLPSLHIRVVESFGALQHSRTGLELAVGGEGHPEAVEIGSLGQGVGGQRAIHDDTVLRSVFVMFDWQSMSNKTNRKAGCMPPVCVSAGGYVQHEQSRILAAGGAPAPGIAAVKYIECFSGPAYVFPPSVNGTRSMRWSTYWIVTLAVVVVGLAMGVTLPLVSLRLDHWGYDALAVGVLAAMPAIGILLGARLAGRLAGRLGSERCMRMMLVMAAFSIGLLTVLPNYWVWLILRLLLGGSLTIIFILGESWIN